MRKYLIIPSSISSSINFEEVNQQNVTELISSSDGVNTFVSYDSGSRPSMYNDQYTELDIEDAYIEFATDRWNLGPSIQILHLDI
jgi:hypothetical protein